VTPDQTAAELRQALTALGGAYEEDTRTRRRARQLGLTGWAFLVAGRGGALGDVRPDTVAAAMAFTSPEAVRDGWEAARRVMSPLQVAEYHRLECCRWGRENLDPFPGSPRLVELAERVVLGAEAAGMPLFAAWRAMPVPETGAGARAAVLLHLLREHRTGAHQMAVRISGLTPLEAIIAGPEGIPGASASGWQPPFPRAEPLLRRRIWAEGLTDRVAGQAYRCLTGAERAELVGVVAAAAAYLREGYPAVSSG
jgi:hypothetical protein